MQDWLKDITIDDMPNECMRWVAETCGLPAAVTMLKECRGIKLNVPGFGFKRLINRKIVEEFDGTNARRLAVRFGVSKAYIYGILRKHRALHKRSLRGQ